MRPVGIAAFENSKRKQQQYSDLSNALIESQTRELTTQLEVFRSSLAYFAVSHAHEIRTNPSFRTEFARMCATIGVDPLASSNTSSASGGSMWASLLGKDVNDFYYELAVKVIEICRATRDQNGGLIPVSALCARLARAAPPVEASPDDIERAVKSLRALGSGFEVVDVAGASYVRSVPKELSQDQAAVLAACDALGCVTVDLLHDNLHWSPARSQTVLTDMVASGTLWVDSQYQGGRTAYWAPSWVERL
ncbi:uncharacterized protein SAPINGB_P000325 [Magnusiomyces paraingens]|uniref:Vacuolar-sorting protein SNF8 n=1 Tax=Magnusiomyces paraingens TaxID=2606893 RepID=A0A5E8AZR0_9ASCO|nr:uncharacterized protein SAPINGB_P000325 [Saprochaete ingens]VVT44164.1 unnamed protein product [Saprochaete ingens]